MGVVADRIIARLARTSRWPLDVDAEELRQVREYVALRDSDRAVLRTMSGWPSSDKRRYMVDPLPEKIAEAKASLVFGRQPKFTAADEADQPRLDELVKANRRAASFGRGGRIASSEGSVYFRLIVSAAVVDFPMVEWVSRLDVASPIVVAGEVRGCAFVSELDTLNDPPPGSTSREVWRHLEVHDGDSLHNLLFHGTTTTLGEQKQLDQHPETEGLQPVWEHQLGILAGRIINQEGATDEGMSDFHGIRDMLLELNESLATGAKNRQLTARKKIVAPRAALDAAGKLPEDSDVLVSDAGRAGIDTDQSADSVSKSWGVVDLSFDAAALIAWQESIARKALSRVGLVAQFVGAEVGPEGFAPTGVALRLRLIPAINSGNDAGEDWDRQVPVIYRKLQVVDAMNPRQNGGVGFGRPWVAADSEPTFDRGAALPRDEVEDVTTHGAAVAAGIESRETAVRALHTHEGWDANQVRDELDRIAADRGTRPPGGQVSTADLFGNVP